MFLSEERVLALDISTKTGWALFISNNDVLAKNYGNDIVLESYGKIEQIHTPDGAYPASFVDWAYACYNEIVALVDRLAPDVLIIEETAAGSKAIYTQKILEWIHFLVAKMIKECKISVVYIMTEQWRRETGCLMSKAESKRNKEVKKYKEKNNTKVAYDAEGKRIGRITRKHVNIRRANEVFGQYLKEPLRKKDEDTADSLLLGYCYHLRRIKST